MAALFCALNSVLIVKQAPDQAGVGIPHRWHLEAGAVDGLLIQLCLNKTLPVFCRCEDFSLWTEDTAPAPEPEIFLVTIAVGHHHRRAVDHGVKADIGLPVVLVREVLTDNTGSRIDRC